MKAMERKWSQKRGEIGVLKRSSRYENPDEWLKGQPNMNAMTVIYSTEQLGVPADGVSTPKLEPAAGMIAGWKCENWSTEMVAPLVCEETLTLRFGEWNALFYQQSADNLS